MLRRSILPLLLLLQLHLLLLPFSFGYFTPHSPKPHSSSSSSSPPPRPSSSSSSRPSRRPQKPAFRYTLHDCKFALLSTVKRKDAHTHTQIATLKKLGGIYVSTSAYRSGWLFDYDDPGLQEFCVLHNIRTGVEEITHYFYDEEVADDNLHAFIASLDVRRDISYQYVKGKDMPAVIAEMRRQNIINTYTQTPTRTANKKGKRLSSPPSPPSPPHKRPHTNTHTHTPPNLTLSKNQTHVLVQGSDTKAYKELIKEIPGYRWNPNKKVLAWTFPRTNTHSVKRVHALLLYLGVRELGPVEEFLYVEEGKEGGEAYMYTHTHTRRRVREEVKVEEVVEEGQEEERMVEGRGREWEKEEEEEVMAVEEEKEVEEESSGREEKAAQEDQEEGEEMVVTDGEGEEKKRNVVSRAFRSLRQLFVQGGGSAQEDGP